MRIKITNTFHNTETTVKVEDHLRAYAVDHEYLTMLGYYAQEPKSTERVKYNRIKRNLCGSKSCMCGGMVKEEIQ